MELACNRGDKGKVKELAKKHSANLVRNYAKRRMLLSIAAKKGLLSTCKVLIEVAGVGIDEVRSADNRAEWRAAQKSSGDNNDLEGMTPLAYACKEGNTAVVKYLLNQIATINIFSMSHHHAMPLHYAVLNGYLDVVKLLVRSGAELL